MSDKKETAPVKTKKAEVKPKMSPLLARYAQIAFYGSILMGFLYIWLFAWKTPGVSHFIFYLFYFAMAIVPVLILESNLESAMKKLRMGVVVLPISLLFSIVYLYRLDGFWIGMAFVLIPIFYGIVLSGAFIKDTYKNVNMISFITLPAIQLYAWISSIVPFIKAFGNSGRESNKSFDRAKRVLRGILIALPFLLIFGLLLVSADENFKLILKDVVDFLDIFEIESGWSLIGKMIVAVLVSLYSMIFYYLLWNPESKLKQTLEKRQYKWLNKERKTWEFISVNSFLGALNLLFLSFVLVQFGYIFGGERNILGSEANFTYAVYARRGFVELMFVALLAYFIIRKFILHIDYKNVTKKLVSKGNLTVMTSAVLVIVISAFARMALYQSIYSFTELRLFVSLVILVIGIVYIGLIVSLYIKKGTKSITQFNRSVIFSVITLFFTVLFLVPADWVVAELTYQRYYDKVAENKALKITDETDEKGDNDSDEEFDGPALDYVYLSTLSDEAIPVMFKFIEDEKTPETLKLLLRAELEHRYKRIKEDREDWQSFNILHQINEDAIKSKVIQGDEELDYWNLQVRNDMENFLEDYRRDMLSEEFESAYTAYWTRSSKPLEEKELKDLEIVSYKIADIPDYERINDEISYLAGSYWANGGSRDYWRGIPVSVDVEYRFNSNSYGQIYDRRGTLYVVIEDGEWKIKDSTLFTLATITDGNKGYYRDVNYIKQNESLDHLKH